MNFYLSITVGLILMLGAACVIVWIVLREKTQEIKRTDIVGTWRGETQTAKAFENGKLILSCKRRRKRTSGTYELVDKNIIRIMLDGAVSQDFKVSISRDKLFVKSMNGAITQYQRTKESED